jgi:hypothetical protein
MFRHRSAIIRDSTNFMFLDSLKMTLWCRNMQELVFIMNCVLRFVFYCVFKRIFLVKVMNPAAKDYSLLIDLKQRHVGHKIKGDHQL